MTGKEKLVVSKECSCAYCQVCKVLAREVDAEILKIKGGKVEQIKCRICDWGEEEELTTDDYGYVCKNGKACFQRYASVLPLALESLGVKDPERFTRDVKVVEKIKEGK